MNSISVVVAINSCDSQYYSFIEHVKSLESRHIQFILKFNSKNIAHHEIYNSKYTRSIWTEDKSIYDAWEQSLELATNDFICFIGCDDRLNKKFVEFVINQAGIQDVIYGDSIHHKHGVLKYIRTGSDAFHDFYSSRPRFLVPHPGMMFCRKLFSSKPSFDKNFVLAGDYDFILKRLSIIQKILYVPIPQATIGKHGVSNQFKSLLKYRDEYKILENRYKVKIRSSIRFNLKLFLIRLGAFLRIIEF